MDRIDRIRSHLASYTNDNSNSDSQIVSPNAVASTEVEDLFLDTDGGRNEATNWNGWGYAVS